jgi:hypothetical protein
MGALRAVPVIGGAVTVANAIVAIGFAGVVMALVLGFDSNPHTPANAYLGAHYTDAYPASHPLLLEVWCALIVAATGLATFRRRVPAGLLLGAAAVLPWIPAMSLLYHVWQLAPAQ